MEYSCLHASSLKVFELIQEIFFYNRIVILGTEYVGKVVGLILQQCLAHNAYNLNPNLEIVYYEMNSSHDQNEKELVFPLATELSRQTKPAVLISADDSETMGREIMEIYRLGFHKIVDGHDLANVNYKPVFFVLGHPETISESEMIMLGQKLDVEHQAEGIPTGIVEKLLAKPFDEEACLALSQHYRLIGNNLLAYEYAERASQSAEYRAAALLEMNTIQKSQIKSSYSELNYVLSLDKSLNLSYLGRSGSIYFGSLMDGHDEIISIPPGVIYDPFPKLYALFCSQKGKVTMDELVAALSTTYTTISYNDWIQMKAGNNNDVYPEDYTTRFADKIRQLLEAEQKRTHGLISEKFLIRLMHYSHYVAIGHEMDLAGKSPYILNHTHTDNYLSIKKYNKLFTNTLNLMTIRDTIQTMGSMMEAYRREQDGKLQGKQVIHLLTYFSLNHILMDSSLASRMLLIPIEKINLDTAIIMKKLAWKLQISWNDSLLESTLNGQLLYDAYGYKDKATFEHGPRITGIAKRYEQYFNSFDRFRLEVLFHPMLSRWGYESQDVLEHGLLKELSLQPFKFEQFIQFKDEHQKIKFQKTFSKVYNQTLSELEDKHHYLDDVEVL
ncbi:hypothetical protein ACN92M_23970 [Paenibacillus polymyxa]|uniref:hypothetical protein n=1 Tax=Paenibacillus polymyxa TaxID=1406 RepID=UPI003B5C6F16